MLEAEIQKLTAAVEALTVQIKALSLSSMQEPALDGPVALPQVPALTPLVAAEQSYQADNAAREKMQADRDAKQAAAPAHEPVKTPKASKKVSEAPAPLDPHPTVSKENLKDMALQISRADTSAKSEIVSILASHNVKTITALPDTHDVLFDVFSRLNNLAAKIAAEAE